MRFSAVVTAALVSLSTLNNSAIAWADSLQMPSDAALARQMQQQNRSAVQTLRQTFSPPVPGGYPAIAPNIKVPNAKQESLDSLIAKFNRAKRGLPTKSGNDLMVFISYSMPKESLIQLSKQAKVSGAVLILRGFKDGSLKATKMAALQVNPSRAPMEVNPNLFKAFRVKTVPTFAVADAGAESVLDNGCAPSATFTTVEGDMSIEMALDKIRLRGQPKMSSIAARRLNLIRAKLAPGHVQ